MKSSAALSDRTIRDAICKYRLCRENYRVIDTSLLYSIHYNKAERPRIVSHHIVSFFILSCFKSPVFEWKNVTYTILTANTIN